MESTSLNAGRGSPLEFGWKLPGIPREGVRVLDQHPDGGRPVRATFGSRRWEVLHVWADHLAFAEGDRP